MRATPVDHTTGRQQAAEAAKNAYLVAHPEPQTETFACPTCMAESNQPCTWGRRPSTGRVYHLSRQDVSAKAFNGRQVEAGRAYDQAWDAYTTAHNLTPW